MKLICFLTFGKEKQTFCDVNNDNTRYFDKSWDLFGNLCHKEKVLCSSIISKGKTRAAAMLKGIL